MHSFWKIGTVRIPGLNKVQNIANGSKEVCSGIRKYKLIISPSAKLKAILKSGLLLCFRQQISKYFVDIIYTITKTFCSILIITKSVVYFLHFCGDKYFLRDFDKHSDNVLF